jgi:hypothetical protein
LKFLVQQAHKNHKGDTGIIKTLIASIMSTCSRKSSGIQPDINGAKGGGKTDAAYSVVYLIPNKFKLMASLSAKTLYYHEDMLDGTILFSDDVEWSKELIHTAKMSQGSFQFRQTHETLDANREVQSMEMPCRLAWWVSAVESMADDQLKDRAYSLDIDSSDEHVSEVTKYIKHARTEKRVRFSDDFGIEVARAIITQIKEHELFKVVIDCADAATWHLKGDHRTQNKFWDLVEAFAILNYQRRVIDKEGWLHATREDFETAKAIFNKRKASHVTHLTNAQTKLIQTLIKIQGDQGATQAYLTDELRMSQQAVSKQLKAILANTPYLMETFSEGEKHYHTTAMGLDVAYSPIGEMVTLPEGYADGLPHSLTTKPPLCAASHLTSQPSLQPSFSLSCDHLQPLQPLFGVHTRARG